MAEGTSLGTEGPRRRVNGHSVPESLMHGKHQAASEVSSAETHTEPSSTQEYDVLEDHLHRLEREGAPAEEHEPVIRRQVAILDEVIQAQEQEIRPLRDQKTELRTRLRSSEERLPDDDSSRRGRKKKKGKQETDANREIRKALSDIEEELGPMEAHLATLKQGRAEKQGLLDEIHPPIEEGSEPSNEDAADVTPESQEEPDEVMPTVVSSEPQASASPEPPKARTARAEKKKKTAVSPGDASASVAHSAEGRLQAAYAKVDGTQNAIRLLKDKMTKLDDTNLGRHAEKEALEEKLPTLAGDERAQAQKRIRALQGDMDQDRLILQKFKQELQDLRMQLEEEQQAAADERKRTKASGKKEPDKPAPPQEELEDITQAAVDRVPPIPTGEQKEKAVDVTIDAVSTSEEGERLAAAREAIQQSAWTPHKEFSDDPKVVEMTRPSFLRDQLPVWLKERMALEGETSDMANRRRTELNRRIEYATNFFEHLSQQKELDAETSVFKKYAHDVAIHEADLQRLTRALQERAENLPAGFKAQIRALERQIEQVRKVETDAENLDRRARHAQKRSALERELEQLRAEGPGVDPVTEELRREKRKTERALAAARMRFARAMKKPDATVVAEPGGPAPEPVDVTDEAVPLGLAPVGPEMEDLKTLPIKLKQWKNELRELKKDKTPEGAEQRKMLEQKIREAELVLDRARQVQVRNAERKRREEAEEDMARYQQEIKKREQEMQTIEADVAPKRLKIDELKQQIQALKEQEGAASGFPDQAAALAKEREAREKELMLLSSDVMKRDKRLARLEQDIRTLQDMFEDTRTERNVIIAAEEKVEEGLKTIDDALTVAGGAALAAAAVRATEGGHEAGAADPPAHGGMEAGGGGHGGGHEGGAVVIPIGAGTHGEGHGHEKKEKTSEERFREWAKKWGKLGPAFLLLLPLHGLLVGIREGFTRGFDKLFGGYLKGSSGGGGGHGGGHGGGGHKAHGGGDHGHSGGGGHGGGHGHGGGGHGGGHGGGGHKAHGGGHGKKAAGGHH